MSSLNRPLKPRLNLRRRLERRVESRDSRRNFGSRPEYDANSMGSARVLHLDYSGVFTPLSSTIEDLRAHRERSRRKAVWELRQDVHRHFVAQPEQSCQEEPQMRAPPYRHSFIARRAHLPPLLALLLLIVGDSAHG